MSKTLQAIDHGLSQHRFRLIKKNQADLISA